MALNITEISPGVEAAGSLYTPLHGCETVGEINIYVFAQSLIFSSLITLQKTS